MVKKVVFVLLATVLCACNSNLEHSEYTSLNNGTWKVNDTLKFNFSTTDTLARRNVFINVRNDNSYEFSNLFLITEMESPDGETAVDTLEYEMASPDGSWLGKGMGSVKESKLWLRENIVFPDSGVYNFKVSHAMRKDGDVSAILKSLRDFAMQAKYVHN